LRVLATGSGVAGEVDPLTSPSHGGGADRARPPERAPSPSPALIPILDTDEAGRAPASHSLVRSRTVLRAALAGGNLTTADRGCAVAAVLRLTILPADFVRRLIGASEDV
jgi:hypothetical protein